MLISRHDGVALDRIRIFCRGGCAATGGTVFPHNHCEGVSLSPEKRTQDRLGQQGRVCLYTEEVA